MQEMETWKNMKIAYQCRYSRLYNQQEHEFTIEDLGILIEMKYVLITIFGLTIPQVQEVEKNNGFTDADLKEKGLYELAN